MKEKVLLGMSGGVDSSVSAILIKKAGYEVIGCTMNLLDEPNEESIKDAKKVCEKLGIEYHVFDCKKEFRCHVIDTFISEYGNARTPNPCVECNQYLKFGIFYDKAKELGCKYIATGHYAKKEYSEKYKQYVLRKSNEEKKDQTYFLYTIPREKVEYILFPLQDNVSKDDTRALAEEYGLEIASKKDSQEICFIKDDDYQRFLKEHMQKQPQKGKIVLTTGEILGIHNGLINYTIGQRKGLGISYKEPLYVVKLDMKNNQVIVGTETELYSNQLEVMNVNWIVDVEKRLEEGLECFAKIRYRAKEAKAKVIKEDEAIKVVFQEPQRAITQGQSVVFYDEDGIVLGGGKIR